jgi:hypothetical protein
MDRRVLLGDVGSPPTIVSRRLEWAGVDQGGVALGHVTDRDAVCLRAKVRSALSTCRRLTKRLSRRVVTDGESWRRASQAEPLVNE